MKKSIFILFVVLTACGTEHSMDLLSPVWNISTNDSAIISNETNLKNLQQINFLLSWERQGYSWMDGNCILANKFFITDSTTDYNLAVSLQCDVKEIYINNCCIGGDIPNTFWSNRGNKTIFAIPDSCLRFGAKNEIRIWVSNLSYTGGHSYNYCQVIPENHKQETTVELSFPVPDHLFSIDDNAIPLTLIAKSSHSGMLNLMIRNDFSDTLVLESIGVHSGEKQLSLNLKKYNLQPGFYECIAILNNGTYAGDVKWFALSPEQIDCEDKPVKEFDAYWEQALKELHAIKPKFRMHKVDSLCSGNRNGYVVEMQSADHITVRGYYFVPAKPGKYPAVLYLPGYGYGFDDLSGFRNRQAEIAELAFCVRGHGISADQFNPWETMTLWAYKICDENENAYRSLYLDCVRAVEFLLSRPEIDTALIAVTGGSQGGGLALGTAGLCTDHISACAYFDPFPCDTRHQLKIRTMVKKELTSYTAFYGSDCTFEKVLEIQDYVDSKNFAGKIKCPVFYATSLFDDDVPPHVGFAAYNKIQTAKSFKIYPNDSHLAESGQYEALVDFIQQVFEEKRQP